MDKKQRERMSDLIPNTFPFPQKLIDHNEELDRGIWSLLEPGEQNCITIIIRKTYGWLKRSDRISNSQLEELTGLAPETIRKVMASLVELGLVIRVSENDPKQNYGVEWALQTDDEKINYSMLLERARAKKKLNEQRMKKARAAIKGVPLSDSSTPVGQEDGPIVGQGEGTPVAQGTQYPLSTPTTQDPLDERGKRARVKKEKKDPNEILQNVIWTRSNDLALQALGDTYTREVRNPMRSEYPLWLKGLTTLKALGCTPDILVRAIVKAKNEWPDNIKSPMSFKTMVSNMVKGRKNETNSASSNEGTAKATADRINERRRAQAG